MSNSLDFSGGGSRPPKSIINAFSTSGFTPVVVSGSGAKQILSGAVTAATLKTILSLTGQGTIDFLSFASFDVTSRTVRCKVTIDSVVVFDSTSSASTGVTGGLVIGTYISGYASLNSVNYNSSVLVEIASSLSETDKVGISVIYKTY